MTTFKVSRMVWEEDDDEDSFEKVGDSSIEKKFFSLILQFFNICNFFGDGRFFKNWAQSLRNSEKNP